MAHQDSDGYIFIVDRKKDMITHHGLHVYPREVEEVIHKFAGIQEVAVVGIGEDEVSDIFAVFAESTPGAIDPDGLADWCRARLADFKLPTKWLRVKRFPRTGSGKIAKQALRDELAKDPTLDEYDH